jgi:hypothetical protein
VHPVWSEEADFTHVIEQILCDCWAKNGCGSISYTLLYVILAIKRKGKGNARYV